MEENGDCKPTWVSSVPIKTRRTRLKSLLAGCISCLRCVHQRSYMQIVSFSRSIFFSSENPRLVAVHSAAFSNQINDSKKSVLRSRHFAYLLHLSFLVALAPCFFSVMAATMLNWHLKRRTIKGST